MSLDLDIYRFEKTLKLMANSSDEISSTTSTSTSKKVRFDDDIQYKDASPLQSQFQPYKDNPDEEQEQEELSQDKAQLFSSFHANETSRSDYQSSSSTNLISNQELFIQQQQKLMEQDSHLDHLSGSVQRSHGISLDINNEVTNQNEELLTDLENLVDNSGRGLERAKRRLEIFEKTARDNGPCFTIVVLIIILFFLLVIL